MFVNEVVHIELQTVQKPGGLSAVYASVHYKERSKSFNKSGA